MSIENEGFSSVDSYYITAVEAVRGLAESVVRERDGEELLRLMVALGQIAGGLREFSSSELSPIHNPHLEVVRTDSGKSESVDAVIEAETVSVNDEPHVPIIPDTKPEQQAAIDTRSARETQLTPEQQQVAGLYPDLRLSPNEAKLMTAIMNTGGVRFKAADVNHVLSEANPSSRNTTMSKLVHKIIASPYGDSLSLKGERGARVYWWHGQRIESEAASEIPVEPAVDVLEDVPAVASETELETMQEDVVVSVQETEASEEDSLTILKRLGIDYTEDGHYFSVRGVPLKLAKLGSDVLMKIAEYKGATTYRTLVNDEELLGCNGSAAARELTTALAEIGTQLRHHDIPWRDVKLPDERGKNHRVIELGNRVPSPSDVPTGAGTSFLAMGR